MKTVKKHRSSIKKLIVHRKHTNTRSTSPEKHSSSRHIKDTINKKNVHDMNKQKNKLIVLSNMISSLENDNATIRKETKRTVYDMNKQKNKLSVLSNRIDVLESNNISIQSKIGLLSSNNSVIQHMNTSTTNYIISIPNLNFIDRKINCLCIDNNKYIDGIFHISNFKISDINGLVTLDQNIDLSKFQVFGNITICSLENSTLYTGLIYSENTTIKYIMSNRPLVPIGITMKSILHLGLKIFSL